MPSLSVSAALCAVLIVAPACVPPPPPAVVTAETPVLVDLAGLGGRTPEAVAAVLGKPRDGSPEEGGSVWYGAGIHLRYVDGRAQQLQITSLGRYRFGPEVLRILGVDPVPSPTQAHPGVLRWENGVVPGFDTVTLHANPEDGSADHANFFVAAPLRP